MMGDDYRTIQLQPTEQVCLVVREYFITRLPHLTIALVLYLGLWFCLTLFLRFGIWGGLAWLLAAAGVALLVVRGWLMWQQDRCLITNERVVDIQKRGLFDTSVRAVRWAQVHDVQYSQHGLMATVWRYGTVTVLVKEAEPIMLQHVYQPAKMRDILSQYVPTLH